MEQTYYPKADVSMSREMLHEVANQREYDLARASVKESMRRLYPYHRYKSESIHRAGRLTVITFVFAVSRRALMFRRLQGMLALIPAFLRRLKRGVYSPVGSSEG